MSIAAPMLTEIVILPSAAGDREFLVSELVEHWNSTTIWSRDVRYEADKLPCFIAWRHGERIGHVTFAHDGGETEIVTLASRVEDAGVGTALLSAAITEARRHASRRVFLTTTNDNLRALAFYQKRGWRLVRVWPGMIDLYRERYDKAIPLIGMNGIPLRDEIELEIALP